MNTKEFLEAVWPADTFGYLILQNKQRWPAIPIAPGLAEITDQHILELGSRPSTEGVFFMPVVFDQEWNEFGRSLRSAGAAHDKHRVGSKVLFLDMDCGPNKDYPDKETALKAVMEFAAKARLPWPHIYVDSGNGCHVYWITEEVMPPAQYVALSMALKAKCEELGLKADPAIMGDVARVMRLPGTMHKKDPDNFKRVTAKRIRPGAVTVAVFEETLKPSAVPAPAPAISSALAGHESGDLSNKIAAKVPSFMADVVKRCSYMATVADDGGAECNENMWWQITNVCSFAEDGAEWAHKLAQGHPEYSHATTQEKFDARIHAREINPSISATTCTKLEEADCTGRDLCGGCVHKGKVKSPIQLGRPIPAEAISVATGEKLHIPFGYALTPDGVMKTIRDPDGNLTEKKILPHHLTGLTAVDMRLEDGGGVDTRVTMHFVKGGPHQAMFSLGLLHDTTAAQKVLTGHRFLISTTNNYTAFKAFIMAWVDTLREAGQVPSGNQTFGWQDNAKGKTPEYSGFIVAETMYCHDGTEVVVPAAADGMTPIYEAEGDFEPWKAAAGMLIKQGRPELTVVLATAFAAPLLALTNNNGAALSIHSKDSGVGKSSALKVAQAVWGNPIRGVNSVNDTTNSVTKKLGIIRNLPLYWDEVRMQDGIDNFVTTLFGLSQGKEKARLTQNIGFQTMGTWNTLMVVATNQRLLDSVGESSGASEAGHMRILEYTMRRSREAVDFVAGDLVFGPLARNYGHAGEKYAAYIAKRQDYIRVLLAKVTTMVQNETGALQGERFWVNTIASILTGAMLAGAAGILDFDVVALKQFLYKVVFEMREKVMGHQDENSADNILNTVLTALAPNTLVTDKFKTTGPAEGPVLLKSVPNHMPVYAHQARDLKTIRVSRAELRNRLKILHVQYGLFMEIMEQQGIVCVPRKASICLGIAGYELYTPRMDVVDIRLHNHKVEIESHE